MKAQMLGAGRLATEAGHLFEIESVRTPRQRSRLLPLWRFAGWLAGALPVLWGSRALYATVEAIQPFVDRRGLASGGENKQQGLKNGD